MPAASSPCPGPWCPGACANRPAVSPPWLIRRGSTPMGGVLSEKRFEMLSLKVSGANAESVRKQTHARSPRGFRYLGRKSVTHLHTPWGWSSLIFSAGSMNSLSAAHLLMTWAMKRASMRGR
eukprot:7824863-Pyramimonas_sp.AAC.1